MPGLCLSSVQLLLVMISIGIALITGCYQVPETREDHNQTTLPTTLSQTVSVNETSNTPTSQIKITATPETTTKYKKTSLPFKPLKVSAPDCEYGGNFKAIEALDKTTIQFLFCEPEVAFLSKVAFPAFAIHSSEWLDQIQRDGDFEKLLEKPMGTGPYQLAEWKPGESLTLTASKDYWREGKPKSPNLMIIWNKDPSQRLLALQTHVVDGIDNLNSTDFSEVRDASDLVLLQRPSMNVFYIGLNNRIPPFDNELLRKALALALDRDRILEAAFPEGYEIASHFAPCAISFACEGEEWYPFDPYLARKILSEAGYPNGFTTELFYRDVLRGYLPRPDLAAEEIHTQLWENLRVNVKVRELDQDEFIGDVDSGSLEGLYLLGWGADYPDMTNFLDPHFGSEASQQFGEKNAELVSLLKKGGVAKSIAGRRGFYQQANDEILRTIPMIPVSHGGWYSNNHLAVAYHADVQNGPVDPFGFEIFSNTFIPEHEAFIWMQTEEPISLYCPDETDSDSLRACMQIYESLYRFDDNSAEAIPNLAEYCEPNNDFTTWTCRLQKEVYFHDHSVMDANDVVMSFWIQWDETHPLHIGNSGKFDYFKAFWGGFISAD